MMFVVPPTRKPAPAAQSFFATLLALVALCAGAPRAFAQAPIPAQYINVNQFTGTASERIDAAIAAAAATDHKTVYFPNGTYALRRGIGLNLGLDTAIHLIGESRDGVQLVPDVTYLENNPGSSVTHMIGLGNGGVFNTVDVSIQNMTLDMQSPEIVGVPSTYKVAGHGIRIGAGWQNGQFTVNEVTIRNANTYGIGIQDRGGHPKNNVTLSNLHIERTGADAIDTKEASGDGNRNLVIRNVSVQDVDVRNPGGANAIDVRYRDGIIENVNLVSPAGASDTGINFRSFEPAFAGIVGFDVSDVYVRGFNTGIILSSNNETHQNIAISDFYIEGQSNSAIGSSGTEHSGHTISDGFVNPDFGDPVNVGSNATVTNVVNSRRDPALTPITDTTFERNVSVQGGAFSPAWQGIVGTERVSLNPNASAAGPFEFTVGNTGVFQVDFDTQFNVMDKLVVEGTINLGGEFRVNLVGGSPLLAGQHQVIDAHGITGAFDQVTLPTAGSRLTWNTDLLETQGIIELTGPNFLLLGDMDNGSYDPSDPADTPPVDGAFLASVQDRWPNFSPRDMDQFGNGGIRAMTFSFAPLEPDTLESVWLEIQVKPLAGYSSDQMVLDSVDRIVSLRDMIGYDGDSTDPQTLRYDLLPSEFALLADGQLNVALQDDAIVDWAGLAWTTLPATVLGDLNGDGSVTNADISSFVLALTDPAGFEAEYPGVDLIAAGDFDGNGTFSNGDINGFVSALTDAGGSASAIPEPASLTLLGLGGFGLMKRRRQPIVL